MSDEEDYNSEEDADYVPSDGELGSEEENSGDEEDLSVLADDAGTVTDACAKKTGKRKRKKTDLAPRKRKGGIKLDEEAGTPAEETNGDAENTELVQKIKEEEIQRKAEKEKKRADDLWSSFLTDVKPQARPAPKAPQTSTACGQQPVSSSINSTSADHQNTSTPSTTATTDQPNTSTSGKITITKVFDFAGEEVKVTKEVDADSKEAKAELKKQEKLEQQQSTDTTSPALTNSMPSSSSLSSPGNSLLGMKKPAAAGGGGLGNVLNRIGKKQKMGTLEKSRMDWEGFKKKEGIEEDLKIHNKGKDGYIERMSFLQRTDLRRFEIERELRLSKSGKR